MKDILASQGDILAFVLRKFKGLKAPCVDTTTCLEPNRGSFFISGMPSLWATRRFAGFCQL